MIARVGDLIGVYTAVVMSGGYGGVWGASSFGCLVG